MSIAVEFSEKLSDVHIGWFTIFDGSEIVNICIPEIGLSTPTNAKLPLTTIPSTVAPGFRPRFFEPSSVGLVGSDIFKT